MARFYGLRSKYRDFLWDKQRMWVLIHQILGNEFPKSPCAVYNPGYKTDYNGNVIQSGIYEAIDYPVFTSDYFRCNTQCQNLRLICSMED